jgi:hypothetical protein
VGALFLVLFAKRHPLAKKKLSCSFQGPDNRVECLPKAAFAVLPHIDPPGEHFEN